MVDKLTDIFCEYGYDGASLTILSQNTGLGRASLYYHFPGGKEEMANAVYEKITRDFTKLVLSPLAADQNFHIKIKNMLEGINLFYNNGQRSCLLDVFAIGSTKDTFHSQIKNAALYWKDSLVKIIKDEGIDNNRAILLSEEIIISIEGALVFARATGDFDSFNRTLENILQSMSKDIVG